MFTDPVTRECLQRPASDPESLQSNMFNMNQLWVCTRICITKYPDRELCTFLTGCIENTKKIIADEEKLNHIRVVDITDNASVCDDATLDALMGTTHNRAVFFPLLCKKTAVLNYVYGSSDWRKLGIMEGESPKEVHAIHFLHSVQIYIPGFRWIGFGMMEITSTTHPHVVQERCQNLKIFRAMLSERSTECCICMEACNRDSGWNTPEAACESCISSYCARCTKQLMKGRRKVMMCAFCKQPVLMTSARIEESRKQCNVYPKC